MVVGEDSEVTDLRLILSAAMDLAVLALIGISDFGIMVSFAMADFSAIAMISSSGTVSLLVLISPHSDSLDGGILTTGIRIPTPTMATHILTTTHHRRTVTTLPRMEPNIGAI
jgi:hypothetical protein